jgi:transposase InsO family protein
MGLWQMDVTASLFLVGGRECKVITGIERICRENGITQRLAKPRSPTTTGKIERLHQTLQLELLNVRGPFASIEDARAAVDGWRKDCNTMRPHESLDMAFPPPGSPPRLATVSACGYPPG